MPDEWIRQWGDPVLREVAAPARDLDDVLRMQLRRMVRRLADADGAGLAATQVGFLRRAFVYRMAREEETRALVNPRIVAASDERATFFEGCLSFNAVTVAVQRPFAVRVEGMDIDGEPVVVEAEGHGASLLQHEIDHLDGILTLDRATPDERRRAIAVLRGHARAA